MLFCDVLVTFAFAAVLYVTSVSRNDDISILSNTEKKIVMSHDVARVNQAIPVHISVVVN